MDTETKVEIIGEENKLKWHIFPVSMSPVDVQLTLHINNMIGTYDVGIIDEFKMYLTYPHGLELNGFEMRHSPDIAIKQLIQYYGVKKWQSWFTLIYGWKFEKVG